MGNLVIAIPNTPAGGIATEHLNLFGQRDLGCKYLEAMTERLRLSMVRNTDLADGLRYTFHLMKTDDGDEIAAINRILSWHNDPHATTFPRGYIELAEPDARLKLFSPNIGLPIAFDPMHQTYLNKLDVNIAHGNNVKGSGVKVAVVDTGADSSIMFIKDFYDIETPGSKVQVDNNGHGTCLASIIHDVAPDAEIYAIRITDLDPTLWYTMAGISTAVFDCQAKIINLSLGFPPFKSRCGACGANGQARSMVFEKFLWALTVVDTGSQPSIDPPVYVTATGNDGNSTGFDYPAAYPDSLAVGSVNSNLKRSSFSNYGTTHSNYLMLPGGDEDAVQNPTEWVGAGSNNKCLGTSVAAAYASGMMALYWSDPKHQQKNRVDILDTLSQKCDKSFSHYQAAKQEYGSGFLYYH
jgi:subtilisin family serine protease